MIGYAVSKNGIIIRLTEERWFHITESHDYLSGMSDIVLDVVNEPEMILKGEKGENFAIKGYKDKNIVVIYKETDNDGFVITAFITSDINKVMIKREITWKKH